MTWEGYELETGIYHDYEYGIVFPEKIAQGRPYIWRTEFFGAFPSVDLAMLKEGYAIVYYRISDLYGPSYAEATPATYSGANCEIASPFLSSSERPSRRLSEPSFNLEIPF